MELEAADPVLLHQPPGPPGAARPRQGSMLAKGISASGCSAQAAAISSLGIGGCPVALSASTVKTTAAIFRSR
nr:hypothetical protein GCM10020093_009470 [Planobispora longispora]